MTAQQSFDDLMMHFPQVASLQKRYTSDFDHFADDKVICPTSQNQLVLELGYALLDIDQANANSFGRYSIALLVDFLKRTHRQYVRNDVPLLAYTLEQIAMQNPDDQRINYILLPLFKKFADDLYAHIHWEENGLFPLALLAHEATISGSQVLPSDYHSNLQTFLVQHPDHTDELELLVKLIGQLGKSYGSDMAFRMLSKQVAELQKDLKLHHLIEEKVLMSKLLTVQP